MTWQEEIRWHVRMGKWAGGINLLFHIAEAARIEREHRPPLVDDIVEIAENIPMYTPIGHEITPHGSRIGWPYHMVSEDDRWLWLSCGWHRLVYDKATPGLYHSWC